jgi:hypothetical protein
MKQAIRERFEDIELSKEQLDELAARFAAEEPAPAKKPAWLRAPAVAAAMIVLAIGGLFSTQVYQSHQDQVLLQSIAHEPRLSAARLAAHHGQQRRSPARRPLLHHPGDRCCTTSRRCQ